ncbi:MAG: penicillin-binding protein [Bacteroidales bacterium]|nr:penicillin-binding protein [Bacteroidales bacterium]
MARKSKNQKKQGKSTFKRLIRSLWLLFFAGIVVIFLIFFMISKGWLGFMPSFEELENPKSNLASEVYSTDGKVLGKYYYENRSRIKYKDLPENIIHALIATEDIRFYKHSGIDLKGTLAGVLSTIRGKQRGASTITQQLAKNLFPRDRDLSTFEIIMTKLKEWVVAVRLERNYSKKEIIAMYLNTVPFGANSFGLKSAAKTYFDKSPQELTQEESAMLVGMLRAPTFYSPVRNPERARHRREVVLHQMEKYDFIEEQTYDSLRQLPLDMLKYKVTDHNKGLATYFREQLRLQLHDWCKKHKKPNGKPYDLYKDGLKIFTTIDSEIQKKAEEAVIKHISENLQPKFFELQENRKHAPFVGISSAKIEKIMERAMKRSDRYFYLNQSGISQDSIRKIFNTPVDMKVFSYRGEIDTVMSPMDSIRYYKHFLQAGLMSVEPQTGYVKAYVGGINYQHFKFDHVLQSRRQVGSTFKPFVYAVAFQELGYHPCTQVPNVPVTFEMPNGNKWTPKNAGDNKEGEMVTLKYALANSINTISAYLMKRMSPERVINLTRKMGIKSPIDPVPAIALGTPDLSVYEMVGALSTFVNKGVYIKPMFITRIEDKNGNVIESFIPKQNEAMDKESAYLMIELLKGVVDHGTGRRLRFTYNFRHPIAGKTGTTDNNSDGWFMGLTPDLVTGVWVGGEDRSVHFRRTYYGQGANTSLPIWAIFMKALYDSPTVNISKGDFEKPKGMNIEFDCEKYNKKHNNNQQISNPVSF